MEILTLETYTVKDTFQHCSWTENLSVYLRELDTWRQGEGQKDVFQIREQFI